MARKTSQEQAETQAETKAPSENKPKAGAKTSSGFVDAKLKSRHCRGGVCKEAGETMRMTRGEYDRLKKYDRVE